jgi:hypothetical protein
MSTSDVLAVVAATVVTILVGALAATLVALARTLRDLRLTLAALDDEVLTLVEDAHAAVREAAHDLDRVERLVSSAERITQTVDGASKAAARTIASPVVKAMAFGTGVSRAAQRLRDPEPPAPAPAPPLSPPARIVRRKRRKVS